MNGVDPSSGFRDGANQQLLHTEKGGEGEGQVVILVSELTFRIGLSPFTSTGASLGCPLLLSHVPHYSFGFSFCRAAGREDQPWCWEQGPSGLQLLGLWVSLLAGMGSSGVWPRCGDRAVCDPMRGFTVCVPFPGGALMMFRHSKHGR